MRRPPLRRAALLLWHESLRATPFGSMSGAPYTSGKEIRPGHGRPVVRVFLGPPIRPPYSAAAVDVDDRLRLDYEQTTQLLRTLIDVRFRLLAFVPTISGIAVAFVGRPRPAAELLAVGLLGLLATLGIFVYELRNTQISGVLIPRATELEKRLQLPSESKGSDDGRPLLRTAGHHRPAARLPARLPRARPGARLLGGHRRVDLPRCLGRVAGDRSPRGTGDRRGDRRRRGRDRPLRGRALPPPCRLAGGRGPVVSAGRAAPREEPGRARGCTRAGR